MNRKQREKLILLIRGYHKKKLPIIPLHGKDAFTKKWSSHCQELPTHEQLEEYTSLVRYDKNVTGFGLPLGSCSNLIAVDIDTEDENELIIIRKKLPESPIVKIGRKGETRFFRYNGEKSTSIKNQAKNTVIEFLANGKQTVLPPSIHPQTQKPYRWKDNDARLLNSDLSSLPTLPEGIINYFSNVFKGREVSIDFDSASSKSSGRNEQLKSIAVAMLYEQKKGVKKIAEELVEYDRKNHTTPLFTDKTESAGKLPEALDNSLRFVANIQASLFDGTFHEEVNRENGSRDEVLTLGQYLEPGLFPERKPIVEKLINHQEFHICSAPSKTGKTIFQLNLAIAVARGSEFLGHFKSHRGRVLIIQTEVSGANFQKRIKAIVGKYFDDISDSIFISSKRYRIDTPTGLLELDKVIKKCKPDLVILDPLYTLHALNEDSSSEMAPMLANLRDLIQRNETSCFLVHHQGKGGGGNQVSHKHRGSSALGDVTDGNWSLSKSQDPKILTLSCELRNSESPLPLRISLGADLQMVSHGYIEESANLSVDSIVEILQKCGELKSGDLTKEVINTFNVSEKTAKTKVSEAFKAQLIFKRRDGKNIFCSSVMGKALDQSELPKKDTSADVKSVGTVPLPLKKSVENQGVKKGATA